MMNIRPVLSVVSPDGEPSIGSEGIEGVRLDQVFAALSDPIRRHILQQLDGHALLVSEIAASFNISLQGVSRHIQVLVRAGLVQQERSGRISRCTLEAGPLLEAAVWLNRYAKYWQGQFDLLAATLADIDERRVPDAPPPPTLAAQEQTQPRAQPRCDALVPPPRAQQPQQPLSAPVSRQGPAPAKTHKRGRSPRSK